MQQRVSLLLPLCALASSALAQQITPLVQEGDSVPGVGLVTSIDNIAVQDTGVWLVESDTDHADTNQDSVLLRSGSLFLREGQALALPAGATLDSFDSVTLNLAGHGGFNFFLDGTSGTNDDSGVYYDAALIVQESDVVDSPAVTPGTPYIGFFDVKINGADQLFVTASIDDPAIASTVDRALVVVQVSGGAYQSTDVRWLEEDVLPGQTEMVADFGTGPHASAFNDAGQILFFADLTGDTTTDGVIYLDGTELAQEGDPSPIAGRNWSSLSSPELALNGAGDYAYSGSLDGDTATNLLLVKNGAKLVQEGDVLAGTAGFGITSFGSGPLSISAAGDVLWYGDWADPDTTIDKGLFLNDQLLVQEGVSQVGGVAIDTLRGVEDGYFLSPCGSFVIFEAILANGLEGAFRIDLPIGARYCDPAVANSTGSPAVITATGSPVAGGWPLTLSATQLPPNQFGYFLASMTQDSISNPGGSQGVLCLGGQIARFVQQVQNSGPGGAFAIPVDTLAIPLSPPTAILSGETWNFTAWYRDVNPTPTSNFTDAVSILFK